MKPTLVLALTAFAVFSLAGVAACDRVLERGAQQPTSQRAPPAEAATYVFTANVGANTVSRIDVSTGEVRRYSLPISPHDVQGTADGERIVLVAPVAFVAVRVIASVHDHLNHLPNCSSLIRLPGHRIHAVHDDELQLGHY